MLLDNARKQTAAALHAQPEEIYFTSCGTESDNWAIRGACELMEQKGKRHIVSTAFEHHAVLHTLQALEKKGHEVTYLDVHSDGLVRVEELKAALREDTGLVTVMFANNEIGTIQPIAEIGKICREKGVLFHTDAVQAVGQIPVDVRVQNIDLLSLSGHKLHAPKGVGALYIRKGIPLPNLMTGGAQERGRRPGTENTASIVALGEAVAAACETMEERARRLSSLRDALIEGALKAIPHSRVNGHREKRLPGNVNMCFEGVEGEALLLMLDQAGICASSGSACTSGSLDPSHVLLAIGLPHEVAHGSLRLSFGTETSMEDIEYILEKLPPIIQRLRDMSPLWERIIKEEQ